MLKHSIDGKPIHASKAATVGVLDVGTSADQGGRRAPSNPLMAAWGNNCPTHWTGPTSRGSSTVLLTNDLGFAERAEWSLSSSGYPVDVIYMAEPKGLTENACAKKDVFIFFTGDFPGYEWSGQAKRAAAAAGARNVALATPLPDRKAQANAARELGPTLLAHHILDTMKEASEDASFDLSWLDSPLGEQTGKIVKAADLLQVRFPEVNYVVSKLFPVGTALLSAKSKLGKSWLAMHCCICVTTGTPFLGHEVSQGAVLYIALEDTPRRLADRIGKLAPDGEVGSLSLLTEVEPDWDDRLRVIEEWACREVRPRLVVIDVWGKFMPPRSGYQGEYEHTNAAIRQLQLLASKHNMCILLIHHNRKNSSFGDFVDQPLGTTGLASSVDTILTIERPRNSTQAVLNVTGRDIETKEIKLTFSPESGLWSLSETTQNALESSLPRLQGDIVACLRSGSRTVAELAASLDKKRESIYNCLKRLNASGVAEYSGGRAWLIGAEDHNQVLPGDPRTDSGSESAALDCVWDDPTWEFFSASDLEIEEDFVQHHPDDEGSFRHRPAANGS